MVTYFYHINVYCVWKAVKICHKGNLGDCEDRSILDHAAPVFDRVGFVRIDRAGAADPFGGRHRCVCGAA